MVKNDKKHDHFKNFDYIFGGFSQIYFLYESREDCVRGTFQDGDVCAPCPVNTTTRVAAASDQSQCEAFCPEGQEEVGGACQPCAIGFFRNNSMFEFGMCEMCPDPDFVTLNPGSTSPSDCTIGLAK